MNDTEKTGGLSEKNGRLSEKTGDLSEKIIVLLRSAPGSSARILAEELGCSSRTIERKLQELQQAGIIKHIGPQKGGAWEVQYESL